MELSVDSKVVGRKRKAEGIEPRNPNREGWYCEPSRKQHPDIR